MARNWRPLILPIILGVVAGISTGILGLLIAMSC